MLAYTSCPRRPIRPCKESGQGMVGFRIDRRALLLSYIIPYFTALSGPASSIADAVARSNFPLFSQRISLNRI